MEDNRITSQVKVYSHSALHSFITGPEPAAQRQRSKVEPYRKRPGLLAFLGLREAIEEVKREEASTPVTQIAAKEPEMSWNLTPVSEA